MSAPNITNYFVGKGIVEFKRTGASVWKHLGNVPEFELTPNAESLEHFSSMEGVRSKDRTIVLKKSMTVRVLMEEWNAHNLGLALLGDPETNSDGYTEIDIFSENAISGELRFTGTNEVGPRWIILLNKVDFLPSSSLNPISDEWGQLEVTGECAVVNGSFGTATLLALEGGESGDYPSESESESV